MDESSKKVVVLQTLDSLWSLPLSFEETIKGANEGLKKQLGDQLAQDQFLPVGDGYVRSAVGKTGKTELQVLPGYNFFQYIKPTKLPELRDSNNRAWDLTDYKALSEEGAPTTTELQSMVKLAREQMNQDFKKTYDPENPVNRETATLAFDPVAAAKVFQAGQAALQRLLTDPKSALEYAQADDEGKASMRESAMNSGFLVGPTEGGAFGDHHFGQFYLILKMKEKYNEAKAEGEALKGDGFSNAMGSAVSIATGGIISANTATKFLHDNKDTINTITTVAAVIAAPFTGGASLLALAAYNGIQGAYNGGVLGAITAAGNAYTSQFGVTTSYTYADGFGASVGYKLGGLVDVGVSYSEKSGFGVSAGVTVGGISAGISYSQEGGFGANVGIKTASGVGMKLSYQDGQGISASLDYKQGNRANGFQSSISYGQDGFSGQVGMAKEGIGRAGLNFSQADGVGVYAGKTLGSGPLGGITSAEIGWNQAKGAQASYGSDTTRVTFSQKDGFGAKFSQDLGFGTVDLAISQRGGFEGSLSGSYNGIKGNLSFSSKEGFSASVSGSLNGKDYNLGINDKGKLSFNESVSVEKGQESLFINSMDELQGMNDQDIAAAKEKIAAKSFEAYQDEMIALNPELKDLKNDPEKFQAKIKELDESGDLKKPAKGNKDAAVDTGDSRDSVFSKVGGYFADLGSSFLGTSVSSGMGFVDENGTFHQRTCFVAGTLVHTKDGLKKIEEIQVGDVVLSWNEETSEKEFQPVMEVFVREADLIYKLEFLNGSIVETTWNHPFWINGRGWVETKDLRKNDLVLTAKGEELALLNIIISERSETVYNFEVATTHTYFISDSSILVHNQAQNGYNAQTNEIEVVYIRSEFEKARAGYDAVDSFKSANWFQRTFQKTGNFIMGRGFNDDETLIKNAGNGIENELEREHAIAQQTLDLGYRLDNQGERDYLAYEFKNNLARIKDADPNSVARVTGMSLYGKQMNINLTADFCTGLYQCANDASQSPQGITPEEVVYRHSNTATGIFLQAAMEKDITAIQMNGLGRPSGGHHSYGAGSAAFDIQRITYSDGINKDFMNFPSGSSLNPDDAIGTRRDSDPRLTSFFNRLSSVAEQENRFTQIYSPYGMDDHIENGYNPVPNVGGAPGSNNAIHLNHLHWGMGLTQAERERDKRTRPTYGSVP
ncbi:polymorphic toxin-type HINT domain-containing protein [Leptospira yasudae]|uniref:polymorphic toxin-type HINT domain-containing protein n=1 Tax=Leptospira yasudae TaxID=2202201 RepID=UPI001AEFBECF|nr:polymorphic toxin-type HINT domain-containing protein [Leptospira yasudae]